MEMDVCTTDVKNTYFTINEALSVTNNEVDEMLNCFIFGLYK